MTLTIPSRTDMVASCDDGAMIARLKLANVPAPLWYATFDDDPACKAVRGFTVGPYAGDDQFSADDKSAWATFTRDDARAAVQEKRGTYIQGYNRIGKSHLAAAQIRASDSDCFWISEADFAAFVYASKGNNDAPDITALIRYLTTPVRHGWRRGKIERVIYDDACARMDYGGKGVYWIGELFLLIEALMSSGIALTITSNADADTLTRQPEDGGLGPRVGSRMLEMTGDPLLLFAPEKKKTPAFPPTAKKVRCTCAAHYPATAPLDTPPEYIEIMRAEGPVQYAPMRWDHILPDSPPPPFDLYERDMTPRAMRHMAPADVADTARRKLAAMMSGLRTAAIMQPVRGDEDEATGDLASTIGKGMYCHAFGAECPNNPGHTDPNFPQWSVTHAHLNHRPYPPKATTPQPEPAQEQAS